MPTQISDNGFFSEEAQSLRRKVNSLLNDNPKLSLVNVLIQLCMNEPDCFAGEIAEVKNRLLMWKVRFG